MNVLPGNTMNPPLPGGPTYTGRQQLIDAGVPPLPDASAIVGKAGLPGSFAGGFGADAGGTTGDEAGVATGDPTGLTAGGIEGVGLNELEGDDRAVREAAQRLAIPLMPRALAGPQPAVVIVRTTPPMSATVTTVKTMPAIRGLRPSHRISRSSDPMAQLTRR